MDREDEVVEKLVERLRASKEYAEWVNHNKNPACFACSKTENLELHHIENIYHSMKETLQFYGNTEEAYQHMLARHANSEVSCATLCEKCHAEMHPGQHRRQHTSEPVDIDLERWFVALRTPPPSFAIDKHKNGLTLLGFQCLLAIGHLLLIGNMRRSIVSLPISKLLRMLGKEDSGATRRNILSTMDLLKEMDYLSSWSCEEWVLKVHVKKKYIKELSKNPWFILQADVGAESVLEMALRWRLSWNRMKKTYRIRSVKLAESMEMSTSRLRRFEERIKRICKSISWADVDIADGMCTFTLRKLGVVPIHSLRKALAREILRQ